MHLILLALVERILFVTPEAKTGKVPKKETYDITIACPTCLYDIRFLLTIRLLRENASEYVVCRSRLLHVNAYVKD